MSCTECTPCDSVYTSDVCKEIVPLKCTLSGINITSIGITDEDNQDEANQKIATAIETLSGQIEAGSLGTVTSVSLVDNSSTPIFDITNSTVTTSGDLDFELNTQSANRIFAGPSTGSAAQPTFRALVAADIPLTFSTGLTNTSGTITNNLSTGVSGGQTVIGSTGTGTGLTFKATTGVGVTGADIIGLVGNNGATEAFRAISSGGRFGVGTGAGVLSKLHVESAAIDQFRISYDTINYTKFVVDTDGYLAISLFGNFASRTTFNSDILANAFFTSSTPGIACLGTGNGNGIVSTTTSSAQLRSSTTVSSRVITGGSGATTIAVGASYGGVVHSSTPGVLANSGTHPIFASTAIKPLVLTYASGGSTAVLTTAATLYVEGVSTQGVTNGASPSNNYSLWVDTTGMSRIDGSLGMNVTLVDASAKFQIDSTTQGFLPPRMTKAQRDLINGGSPAIGLVVYQTDNTPGLRCFNGTNWIKYSESTD